MALISVQITDADYKCSLWVKNGWILRIGNNFTIGQMDFKVYTQVKDAK